MWKSVVFNGVREISDPMERIKLVIENSLQNYLGGGVFEGGCFLLNSLVDLAGQAPDMSNHVLKGFQGFAGLIHKWLAEAEQKGLLQEGLNLPEIANFLVIAVNGASPLYAASKDPALWRQTMKQLHYYLQTLRKDEEEKINHKDTKALRITKK